MKSIFSNKKTFSETDIVIYFCRFLFFLNMCLKDFFFVGGGGGRMACGILVPRPGIEPASPTLEAQCLNHWTALEVPIFAEFLNIWLT